MLRPLFFIAYVHYGGSAYDYNIAYKAVAIGYLSEEEKSQQCRKYYLKIVEYGYFLGRCVGVGRRYGKLSARCGYPSSIIICFDDMGV